MSNEESIQDLLASNETLRHRLKILEKENKIQPLVDLQLLIDSVANNSEIEIHIQFEIVIKNTNKEG
jgi:hypothetical protein